MEKNKIFPGSLMIATFICIFTSCSQNKEKYIVSDCDIPHIHVELTDYLLDIMSSNNKYFKSVKYIQLETSPNFLIGKIDKIITGSDRIYIMDCFISKAVFIFNQDGDFINKIDRRGEGYEEYQDILNIFYDDIEEIINIVAPTQDTKIMTFDKNGNKLLRQTNIDLKSLEIERSRHGMFVTNAKNAFTTHEGSHNLTVLTSDLTLQYTAFPIKSEWEGKCISLNRELFKNYKNELFYTPSLNTNVYQITSDSITRRSRPPFFAKQNKIITFTSN